jgi:hypothetical protein
MSPAVVMGLFDLVAVVPAAFDDPGVAAVTARPVQVAAVGDLPVERGDDGGVQVRGKTPPGR